MKYYLLALAIVLVVPGLIFATMFILMSNGVDVNVENWITFSIVATVAIGLYELLKIG